MNQEKGHPAHREILDLIPTEFHSTISPILSKWDKGVQEKLQEVHGKYEPYKFLVENEVPAEFVQQSLALAGRLDEDPAGLVSSIVEAFEVPYVPVSELDKVREAQAAVPDEYEEDDDLLSNPIVKQLQEKLNVFETRFKEEDEKTEKQKAQEALDAQLSSLAEAHGEYDKTYVIALMSQGMDGETAVKQYQDNLNQAAERLTGKSAGQANDEEAPVIMGGNGDAGGTLVEPVSFGQMKDSDINQIVQNMLSSSTD